MSQHGLAEEGQNFTARARQVDGLLAHALHERGALFGAPRPLAFGHRIGKAQQVADAFREP